MARFARKRHARRSQFPRTARSKHYRGFLTEQATDLNGTGASTAFTGAAGTNLTSAAHGLAVGDGPFVVTTDDTVPGGMVEGGLVWVQAVPDANTLRVSTVRGGPALVLLDAGTGNHSLVKADTVEAMHEYLRTTPPEVLRDATDVDAL